MVADILLLLFRELDRVCNAARGASEVYEGDCWRKRVRLGSGNIGGGS